MMATEERTARLPLPVPGEAPYPAVPVPERYHLRNGLRVVVVDRPALPQISARLIIPAGSVADPASAPGTASLTAALVTEGTRVDEATALHQRIDSLGASLCARAGHDFTEVDLGLLSETVRDGFTLLAEVVTTPTLPEREFERVRAESIDALEARLDEPANLADDHTSEALFGEGHPYARLPLGTVEGVRALQRDALVAFHRAYYRPAGSVIVIAGDVGGGLREILEATLGEWEGEAVGVPYPPPPRRPVGGGRLSNIELADSAQGEIRVAGLGMARNAEDWPAAAVANYVLGGSTITGRLGANLREEKGWTYGVRSGFAAGVQPAGWVVETAVGAEATADAITEIEKELQRMVAEPVDADELARAKEALILSLPRAFETPGRIVARLATVEAYGLEPDYWARFVDRARAVGAAEVQEMARRYFDPRQLVRVAVGPRIAALAEAE